MKQITPELIERVTLADAAAWQAVHPDNLGPSPYEKASGYGVPIEGSIKESIEKDEEKWFARRDQIQIEVLKNHNVSYEDLQDVINHKRAEMVVLAQQGNNDAYYVTLRDVADLDALASLLNPKTPPGLEEVRSSKEDIKHILEKIAPIANIGIYKEREVYGIKVNFSRHPNHKISVPDFIFDIPIKWDVVPATKKREIL